MSPYSYTGVKIIHEQRIQEALERRRFAEERKARQHTLKHIVGVVLARFTSSSAHKPQATVACSDGAVECSAS